MKTISKLPSELTALVNSCLSLLGEVIKEEGGNDLYQKVEKIRKTMVSYRQAGSEKKQNILAQQYKNLKNLNKEQRHSISHSISLMFELINSCEASFRTYKIDVNEIPLPKQRQENKIVYVLTAHPTEARSSENVELFIRIQNLLTRILRGSGEDEYLFSLVKHNLKLLWLIPITYHEKPQVVDEANYLFSIILREDIFNTLLRANRDLGTVRVRTWVGGDKDGHPGVDDKVMVKCLEASRTHFIKLMVKVLGKIEKDLDFINETKLKEELKRLGSNLQKCQKIGAGDFSKICEFSSGIKKFNDQYKKLVGIENSRVQKILLIMELFPALVIPIEMREDSEIIAKALRSDKDLAIVKMLKKLKEICGENSPANYAQGMIISMCCSYTDINNTMKLVENVFGRISLPIIPLFETADALKDSLNIVKETLADKNFVKIIKTHASNQFEIMLGYSDSSKGMGVWASKLGIAQTMRSLDLYVRDQGIKPLFFHGSGGSVDRGGGSLKDQISWWPLSAINLYKATIQGEMVERTFSSPEIIFSGMSKVFSALKQAKGRKGPMRIGAELEEFAEITHQQYADKIADPFFFKMVEKATPYAYLTQLKLGSRPTKRSKAKSLDFRSIRAIPWVLCWTQTRTLFPTWWGVGTAYKDFKKSPEKLEKLKKNFSSSSLFSSFIRVLGFSLSKVDLELFNFYLKQSDLSPEERQKVYDEFRKEYLGACQFVYYVSESKNLLWYKPWLKESINLRSPMIHPLNILQVIAKEEGDHELIRKTVAGISLGMLTTG